MDKDLNKDIGEDEIRIISRPRPTTPSNGSKQIKSLEESQYAEEAKTERGKSGSASSSKTYKIIIGLMVVLILALVLFIIFRHHEEDKDFVSTESIAEACEETIMSKGEPRISSDQSFIEFSQVDTELSPLIILTPKNCTPILEVGQNKINNPDAMMIFQAADVRGDNYQINGAFVEKGELLSRGQSKSGYCAIIDGEINLGVAEATPLLEKAIETDGYFFRQYPLVAGGQIVENKLQTHSYRKALAKIGEKAVVVISQKRLTLYEFSQALIDAGVSEAIYLIGGNAFGFAVDATGDKVTFGEVDEKENPKISENVNYIVWY